MNDAGTDPHDLRRAIADFLRFAVPAAPASFEVLETVSETGFTRERGVLAGPDGDSIPAHLLVPDVPGRCAAVIVHHQHNGERHLGKSEVCGLAGDPLQAFGPALARQGMVVLAPDSICFEDRRRGRRGIDADPATDGMHHYDEMCARLVRGDTLMRKVLADSAQGVSALLAHPRVDPRRVGAVGHSYGGNTVLFHAALDERVRFACSSGAACSYAHKLQHGTGIEMAEVIPGFAARFDVADLVTCIAPRPLLVVSATEDRYSQDADEVVAAADRKLAGSGVASRTEHVRYEGDHALTPGRFDAIVRWITAHAA